MSSNNSSSTSSGIGFTGVLTIVFIVLKLLNKITWSWVWVLSPMWISGALALLAVLIVIVLALVLPGKHKPSRRYIR